MKRTRVLQQKRFHPGALTLLFMASLILIMTLRPDRPGPWLFLAVFFLLSLGRNRADWKTVLGRLLHLLPIVFFLAALYWLGAGGRGGVLRFTWVMLGKSVLVILASMLAALYVSLPELILFLQRCRMPLSLTGVLFFGMGTLGAISDQGGRLRNAIQVRSSGRISPRRRWELIRSLSTLFFVRLLDKSDRIYAAMLVRGFSGRLVVRPYPPLTFREAAYTLGILTLFVGVRGWL